MDIHITGNPGTGNTFQEIHIGKVQNYNPNATTVINYNYGDKPQVAPLAEKPLQDAEKEQRKAEILDYVSRLKDCVARDWKNRYEALWTEILALPEVDAVVYDPGKQQGTSCNRNLLARIIYIMCKEKVIAEDNATQLTLALEGDKDHPVRAQLKMYPDDSDIRQKVSDLIANHH